MPIWRWYFEWHNVFQDRTFTPNQWKFYNAWPLTGRKYESGNLKPYLLDFLEASTILAVNSAPLVWDALVWAVEGWSVKEAPSLPSLSCFCRHVGCCRKKCCLLCPFPVSDCREVVAIMAALCSQITLPLSSAKLLCVWLQEFRLDFSPFWMEWRQRFQSRVSVSHSGVIHRDPTWSLLLRSF